MASSTAAPNHSPEFYVDDKALDTGIKALPALTRLMMLSVGAVGEYYWPKRTAPAIARTALVT
ncbi:hypothetical protein [Marinobacter lipolyticus]|uniref:hypothetical protein n=1 Tax=Marinobacter lipolyticus TaxID=209639 RepID=UPI003A9409D2